MSVSEPNSYNETNDLVGAPENMDEMSPIIEDESEIDYSSDSSLIVPAYNEEEVIRDTLEHLEGLTPYFEDVYLVDDASTDGTHDEIEKYLAENDSDVKVTYMRENGDKIGAISGAAKHCNSENIVLTDADTRLMDPERIEGAQQHMEENGYGALAFKVVPDSSGSGILDKIWDRAQDFDYAIGRAMSDYTTGKKLRIDEDDKNVRCIAGAGGMYNREVFNEAMEHHSGNHAGDDIETTAITQLVLGEDVDYFEDIEFQTDVPKDLDTLTDQRQRWSRGAIQAFSQHPKKHLNEAKDLSRYGQTIAYEAGITSAAPVLLGKAAFEASQGDFAQTADSVKMYVAAEGVFSGGAGLYAGLKGEFKDKATAASVAVMPFYRPATFFPAKLGSQKDTIKDVAAESREEFSQGLEEGIGESSRLKAIGESLELYKNKAKTLFSDQEDWEEIDSRLEENHEDAVIAD